MYMYLSLSHSLYVYIYIERERERENALDAPRPPSFRGKHLSNTTCLTHSFFNRGEESSKLY